MKNNIFFSRIIAAGFLAMLMAVPLMCAERPQEPREQMQRQQSQTQPMRPAPAPRSAMPAMAQRPAAPVDRFNHGTIRHIDTQIVRPPVVVNPGRQRPDSGQPRPEYPRPQYRPNSSIMYHDVEVDTHHEQYWHNFVFGAHLRALRDGYIQIFISGAPYYYDDGIYYQQLPADNSYQEVYPPIGAEVQALPDGAIEVDTTETTYFYAGGAFYVQDDNGFQIVPTPMGVLVPELPPGAVQVSVNGYIMYQFNGVYYQPLFENGITQYITTPILSNQG